MFGASTGLVHAPERYTAGVVVVTTTTFPAFFTALGFGGVPVLGALRFFAFY